MLMIAIDYIFFHYFFLSMPSPTLSDAALSTMIVAANVADDADAAKQRHAEMMLPIRFAVSSYYQRLMLMLH